MTGRFDYTETRVDRDVGTEERIDYAAEYRNNVHNVSGQLKSLARFPVDQLGAFQEVEVPAELQHHRYIAPMVAAINAHPSFITHYRGSSYRRAFSYILRVAADGAEPDWRYFGRALLKRLKSELTSENTIKSNMDNAKRLFNKAADASTDVKVRREIRAMVGGNRAKGRATGYWPDLRAVEPTPLRSLEDIFGDSLNYTNEQYIDAIIDYASTYIRAWSNIRSRFQNDHPKLHAKIFAVVTRIGVAKLKDIERKRTHSRRMQDCKEEWFELLGLNIELLVAMDDPFLNAIAMSQWKNTAHFDRFAASVDLPCNGAAGFAAQLLRRKPPCSQPKSMWSIWKNGKNDVVLKTRLMLSLLDFFGPTLEEEICFTWLLATRRIQLSNTDRIKRRQIDEDATGIWIRSYKGRNNKAENIGIKKNTKFGRALRAFLQDYDKYPFRIANSDNLISPYKQYFSKFHSTRNFHHLNSEKPSEGLCVYGLSDANLMVIRDIYAVVVKNERQNGRARNYGDAELLSSKGLLPSAIAQSHVYAEEAKRGKFFKSATMLPTYDREDLDENSREAQNEFHSLQTREEIYRARSKDKVKLQRGRAFSSAVSEEMANIANDIIDAWEQSTSYLPVSALVDVIGLRGNTSETHPATILAAAKAEKFIVEKSGLIKKNGKIYLFDSGLTARMMMEEIRHIEAELDGLFATNDVDKAINAWAKLCFLELLLKRFSSVSLKESVEKYGHLEGKIPHAPISEGGNSWIVQ